MNKARRKELAQIVAKLEALEALHLEIKDELQAVIEEEQEAFDNLPEGFQESERGEQMQEYIDAMESALDDLEQLDIDEVRDQLTDICG